MLIKEHLNSIIFNYGDESHIQIPNNIFNDFSKGIKDTRKKSFGYAYFVLNAILFKYTHYVDLSNESYITVGDFKEALGYRFDNKTINNIIKKGGALDEMGATKTIDDFPIYFNFLDVKNNGIDFVYMSELESDCAIYNKVSSIVKNRNYSVKVPVYLFNYDNMLGTFFSNYRYTYTVKVSEIYMLLFEMKLSNTDIYIYLYLKSECFGMTNNSKYISLEEIMSTLNISSKTLYKSLNILKDYELISVNHRGWQNSEKTNKLLANNYTVFCK